MTSCVFFARKSVIAREFLLEIDTSLAIATSGLRTDLLLQDPPLLSTLHLIFPMLESLPQGDANLGGFVPAQRRGRGSADLCVSKRPSNDTFILRDAIGPSRITQLISQDFSGVTNEKFVKPINSLRLFWCKRSKRDKTGWCNFSCALRLLNLRNYSV